MEQSPKYYIVEAAALPEIFQKVAEAKRQRGRAGCRHQPQRVL